MPSRSSSPRSSGDSQDLGGVAPLVRDGRLEHGPRTGFQGARPPHLRAERDEQLGVGKWERTLSNVVNHNLEAGYSHSSNYSRLLMIAAFSDLLKIDGTPARTYWHGPR
jgi:hypothetical protein